MRCVSSRETRRADRLRTRRGIDGWPRRARVGRVIYDPPDTSIV